MGTNKTETAAAGAAPAPDPRTREALEQENLTLKGQLAAFEAEKARNTELEEKILAKTAKGLSREQALAVIQHQAEFDQAQAKARTKGSRQKS
jgi:hypothetical protein